MNSQERAVVKLLAKENECRILEGKLARAENRIKLLTEKSACWHCDEARTAMYCEQCANVAPEA